MPVDFRTNQLKVNQIINSGSSAGKPLLIYGLGSSTDDSGGFNAAHFVTGSDTWLFISGTAGSRNSANRGAVAFGGDVVVSGALYNAAGAAYSTATAISWNELSPSPRLNTTASVSIAGTLGTSYAAQSAGSDVFFFVSGTNSNRLSLFGGGVTLSGSLRIKDTSANTNIIATPQGVVSCSSDLEVGGNATVAGGVVTSGSISTKNGAGSTVFIATNSGAISGSSTLEVGGNATIAGNLRIDGLATTIGNSSSDRLFVSASVETNVLPSIDSTFDLGSPAFRWKNIYTGDLHLRNERGDYTLIEEEDFLSIRFNKTGKRYKFLLEPIPELDEK
jgi:hypothetical protein